MKYIIPFIPPSMNKFAGRKNVWEYREEKRKLETNLLCVLQT